MSRCDWDWLVCVDFAASILTVLILWFLAVVGSSFGNSRNIYQVFDTTQTTKILITPRDLFYLFLLLIKKPAIISLQSKRTSIITQKIVGYKSKTKFLVSFLCDEFETEKWKTHERKRLLSVNFFSTTIIILENEKLFFLLQLFEKYFSLLL